MKKIFRRTYLKGFQDGTIAGNEFANWVAFIAGIVYVTWVVRVIIRVR